MFVIKAEYPVVMGGEYPVVWIVYCLDEPKVSKHWFRVVPSITYAINRIVVLAKRVATHERQQRPPIQIQFVAGDGDAAFQHHNNRFKLAKA